MGRVEGKVAFITGAARGQGRSHAIRLAEEGADIIAIDVCADIDTVGYAMATEKDLQETVQLVESLDRRIISQKADVRNYDEVERAVQAGLAEFGHVDIVSANAGIVEYAKTWEFTEQQWSDVMDINIKGVWHTVKAVTPSMIAAGNGGSIILTSSLSGLKGLENCAAYTASKFGVTGLTRVLANELGPHYIRVNSLHPTNVNTAMVQNPGTYGLFRPDITDRDATMEEFIPGAAAINAIPVPWVEPIDVSNALLFLASDESRYITGAALPVDAGAAVK
jgi:SDR family mycofactocin-dependent oxidoreductase